MFEIWPAPAMEPSSHPPRTPSSQHSVPSSCPCDWSCCFSQQRLLLFPLLLPTLPIPAVQAAQAALLKINRQALKRCCHLRAKQLPFQAELQGDGIHGKESNSWDWYGGSCCSRPSLFETRRCSLLAHVSLRTDLPALALPHLPTFPSL